MIWREPSARVAIVTTICTNAMFAFVRLHRRSEHELARVRFLLPTSQTDVTGSDQRRLQSGAAHQAVSTDELEAFAIPVPPLAEQQRIVGILDEAFAGIATAKANAEKNLQNARALFESHLQSVFTQRGKGWVETTLEEICEFDSGLSTSLKTAEESTVSVFGCIQRHRRQRRDDYIYDKVTAVSCSSVTTMLVGEIDAIALIGSSRTASSDHDDIG